MGSLHDAVPELLHEPPGGRRVRVARAAREGVRQLGPDGQGQEDARAGGRLRAPGDHRPVSAELRHHRRGGRAGRRLRVHADRPPPGIPIRPAGTVDGSAVVVIPEMPQHVGHAGAAGRREEAAALAVAALRSESRLGVLEGGAEVEPATGPRRPPAALRRVGFDPRRRLVPVVADGREVGDRRPPAHPPRDPVAAGGLQHPGRAGVRDDEAVVVVAAAAVLGAAALAVALEEIRDDALGLVGGPPALETEPDEVHPEKARLGGRLPRVERLVSDRHAPRVDAVLEAPDPPGTAAEDGQRLGDLGNLEVRAPHGVPGGGAPGRHRVERLALGGRAVAVLGEEGPAVARLGAQDHQGVAARVHRDPSPPSGRVARAPGAPPTLYTGRRRSCPRPPPRSFH